VIDPEILPASGEGAQTASAARRILEESRGQPLFLWVHFFDAHLPYLPPAPFDRVAANHAAPRDTAALYAGEVAFLDECVGSVARAVDEANESLPTSMLIVADHGEGLGEHRGYFGHDTLLYDTSLRVPMIFSGGKVTPSKVPIPGHVRTIDVAPTIAGALLPPGASRAKMEGRDLLRDPEPSGDALLFVAETHPAREKSTPLYALRTAEHKVIWEPRHGRREYYDLARDPAERFDLASDPPEILRVLAEDLELDLRNRPVGRTQTIDELRGGADDATRAALESLGYVGN
jgi:arylsulfatase A-like enzyme